MPSVINGEDSSNNLPEVHVSTEENSQDGEEAELEKDVIVGAEDDKEEEEYDDDEEEDNIVSRSNNNTNKIHVNTFETAIEENDSEQDSEFEDDDVEPIQASLVLQIVSSGPDGSANVKVRRP